LSQYIIVHSNFIIKEMLPGELVAIVIVILLILTVMLRTSSRSDHSYGYVDHTNMRHTDIDGIPQPDQRIPSPWTYEPPQFMGARYKVIADDGLGDNVEPLDDMVNSRIFKNPIFEKPTPEGFSDTSQTFWLSDKSTPTIANDDKQLIHSSAELQTPYFRAQMSSKSKKFLPFTGGRSRLNFSSFENSNDERAFRQ